MDNHPSDAHLSESVGEPRHQRTGERMYMWLPLPNGEADTRRMRIPTGWLYRVDLIGSMGNRLGMVYTVFVPEPADTRCNVSGPTNETLASGRIIGQTPIADPNP